jgi:hypothetical protein
MNNVTDSKERRKSRSAASTVFKVGLKRNAYRQPVRVYQNWAYRPERAAKEDFAAKEGN